MALDPVEHLGLAYHLARGVGPVPDPEAVLGAAVLAVVKACPGFDPARGCTPATYLHPHILGACRKEARRQRGRREDRLYVLTDDGEERERPDIPSVDPHDGTGVLVVRVLEELARLTPREREILVRRYGLAGEEQNFREIGAAVGLGPQRVRQIEAKARTLLRRRLSRPRQIQKVNAGTARS